MQLLSSEVYDTSVNLIEDLLTKDVDPESKLGKCLDEAITGCILKYFSLYVGFNYFETFEKEKK